MKVRDILVVCLLCAAGAGIVFAAQAPVVWIDVPFAAQTTDGCGSASISMVMRYWAGQTGQSVPAFADPVKIQAALYSSKDGGIPASKMEHYFQGSGYRVFSINAEWQDLQHNLEQGRPLIVSLRASGPRGPLHYVVVVGIDSERGYVFVNDPAQQKMLRISREGFEKEWNPTHNWALLAVPLSGTLSGN